MMIFFFFLISCKLESSPGILSLHRDSIPVSVTHWNAPLSKELPISIWSKILFWELKFLRILHVPALEILSYYLLTKQNIQILSEERKKPTLLCNHKETWRFTKLLLISLCQAYSLEKWSRKTWRIRTCSKSENKWH